MYLHLLFDVTCLYLLTYLRGEGWVDLMRQVVITNFLQIRSQAKLSTNYTCESTQSVDTDYKLHVQEIITGCSIS